MWLLIYGWVITLYHHQTEQSDVITIKTPAKNAPDSWDIQLLLSDQSDDSCPTYVSAFNAHIIQTNCYNMN